MPCTHQSARTPCRGTPDSPTAGSLTEFATLEGPRSPDRDQAHARYHSRFPLAYRLRRQNASCASHATASAALHSSGPCAKLATCPWLIRVCLAAKENYAFPQQMATNEIAIFYDNSSQRRGSSRSGRRQLHVDRLTSWKNGCARQAHARVGLD